MPRKNKKKIIRRIYLDLLCIPKKETFLCKCKEITVFFENDIPSPKPPIFFVSFRDVIGIGYCYLSEKQREGKAIFFLLRDIVSQFVFEEIRTNEKKDKFLWRGSFTDLDYRDDFLQDGEKALLGFDETCTRARIIKEEKIFYPEQIIPDHLYFDPEKGESIVKIDLDSLPD